MTPGCGVVLALPISRSWSGKALCKHTDGMAPVPTPEAATKAVTEIDFGLRGLTARQTKQLSDLLARVRKSVGDFTD